MPIMATIPARTVSPPAQPWAPISSWPIGTMTNCPTDPQALTRPSAMLRFSAGTTRATAPSTTAKLVPESPSPTKTPALK